MTERINISSGTEWESVAGYSRAVRIGPWVEVAGTTAVDQDGRVIGSSAAEQSRFIFEKIADALEQAGGSLADVVRTRMFIVNLDDWQQVAQVHGEVFGAIRPASTLVQVAGLIQPDLLVEIEVSAVLPR